MADAPKNPTELLAQQVTLLAGQANQQAEIKNLLAQLLEAARRQVAAPAPLAVAAAPR